MADEGRLHAAVANFAASREASLRDPPPAPRAVRLPLFVPPDFRPLLSSLLRAAAEARGADALEAMAAALASGAEEVEPAEQRAVELLAPPAEAARVERVVGAMVDEWARAARGERRRHVALLLQAELAVDRLLREAGEHARSRGEEYVRCCLLPLHREAELVRAQNKRKKTKQSLQFDRVEARWYLVDEGPEGIKKEEAPATLVIDAAVAEYGPDLLDNDPSRKVFHVTWNKGMKRGE
ncbi:hypothetical protein AB1Y20_021844 [Prymnesium parvum]|uniref:Uncharacterized protein n=1 Tax=Prymnesium parvum TaxID=97485 RepID=A0AB34JLD8_PRYPA